MRLLFIVITLVGLAACMPPEVENAARKHRIEREEYLKMIVAECREKGGVPILDYNHYVMEHCDFPPVIAK